MNRFIENYNLFLNSSKETTPELYNEYKPTLPKEDEKVLDFFIKNWYPYMREVSTTNLEFFEKNQYDPFVFENVSFLTFMQSLSNKNKDICWEYLHTLFALSYAIPYTKEHYQTYTPETDDSEEYQETMKFIEKTITDFPEIISNMVTWKRTVRERENKEESENNKSEEGKSDEEGNSFIENSSIGKLAKEISEELKSEDIDLNASMEGMDNPMKLFQSMMSGDKNNGIGKLVHTVTDKLQKKMEKGEFSQEDLLKDATKMFTGGLGGDNKSNGMPDLSSMMNMMKNMSGMADMFQQAGNPKSRKVRRRLQKKLKK